MLQGSRDQVPGRGARYCFRRTGGTTGSSAPSHSSEQGNGRSSVRVPLLSVHEGEGCAAWEVCSGAGQVSKVLLVL